MKPECEHVEWIGLPRDLGEKKTSHSPLTFGFLVSFLFGLHFEKSIWKFTSLYFAKASRAYYQKASPSRKKNSGWGQGSVRDSPSKIQRWCLRLNTRDETPFVPGRDSASLLFGVNAWICLVARVYLLSSPVRGWIWVGVNTCKCHQSCNTSAALSYQSNTALSAWDFSHPTVGTSRLLAFFWPQENILKISGSYYMLSELRSSWIPYEVTLVRGD